MKLSLKFLLFITMVGLSAFARADAFVFADIAWGSNKTEVTKALKARGYAENTKLASTLKKGDLFFNGNLAGENAQVYAIFTGDSLMKIVVNLPTADEDAIATYKKMKDALSLKYEPPNDTYEYFKEPYYDGDGYETQAIRLGKATFFSVWKEEKGSAIGLSITKELTVHVTYESALWLNEARKRQQKAASDL